SVNSKMIVFGGEQPSVNASNDVWVLSNANGVGTPTWNTLSPTGGPPPARAFHAAVYDAASNRMIVFGGSQASQLSNDVWVLSNANGFGGTPAWSQIIPVGTPPAARSEHSTVYDAASNRMIVFGGGIAGSLWLNDVWVLSNANGLGGIPAWTQLSV